MLANKALSAAPSAVPAYIEDVFSTYLWTGNATARNIVNGILLGNGYSDGAGASALISSSQTQSNYLLTPTNTAFQLGTSNFTLEWFVYRTATVSGNEMMQLSTGTDTYSPVIGYMASDTAYLYMSSAASSWDIASGKVFGSVPLNTWVHLALVRDGSTFYLFNNGNLTDTFTSSSSIYQAENRFCIGGGQNFSNYSWRGSLARLRFVKGTALYTSNFTPPTSDLTAVTNTQLLCLQGSNVFTDTSANGFTLTNNNVTQSSSGPVPLNGKGGMVWTKYRNTTNNHRLYDTARGATKEIYSSLTNAESTASQSLTAFNADGFSLGTGQPNENTATVVGWTFRKQEKFFDVVTFTGTGSNLTVNHNLGSVPGMIVVKGTSVVSNWYVYHRSLGATKYLRLNATTAETTSSSFWNDTEPTSTNFTIGNNANINDPGQTYVAYLFAHDAGGFGASGSDNVISCGSFTTNGSGTATVTLGYEPQWLMIKASSTSDDWNIGDSMRGMPNGGTAQTALKWLKANSSSAESTVSTNYWYPTATGFTVPDAGYNNTTFIYIAIRRGPMKTPTSGTSVFSPIYTSSSSTGTKRTTNFAVDTAFIRSPLGGENNHLVSRLQGVSTNTTEGGQYMYTQATNAEASSSITRYWDNTGFQDTAGYNGYPIIYYAWKRAPGFFDVVCYTGTGSSMTLSHNLAVSPELIILKERNASGGWIVYSSPTGFSVGGNLAGNGAFSSGLAYVSATSSTTFTTLTNASTYVAYLFSSVTGVSKVGSYTGTGSTQTINCGFTAGSRFVMVKRTDSTGDWYVWDSARGIVSGNDPYLLLNSTAAEVTNTDYIDTANSGFEISSTAPAAINVNNATYIFYAVA
jgi:hypothetical protein